LQGGGDGTRDLRRDRSAFIEVARHAGVRVRTSAATRTASALQAARFPGDVTLFRPDV